MGIGGLKGLEATGVALEQAVEARIERIRQELEGWDLEVEVELEVETPEEQGQRQSAGAFMPGNMVTPYGVYRAAAGQYGASASSPFGSGYQQFQQLTRGTYQQFQQLTQTAKQIMGTGEEKPLDESISFEDLSPEDKVRVREAAARKAKELILKKLQETLG